MRNLFKCRRSSAATFFCIAHALTGTALLQGCAGRTRPSEPQAVAHADARLSLERALPKDLADRAGWAADINVGFTLLSITPSPENICAVSSVIEQESGFRVDPVVPNLAAIAWREIDERAGEAGVPKLLVHGVLELPSPTGRTYAQRIDAARTEKELSDIYEDFIDSVPLGERLFAQHNPIKTRGPMQVQVSFAERFAAKQPYPYPVRHSIADEVFTRRGGLYFGVAHLLDYPADYPAYVFRFADFNAGQYASRNAAFQHALGIVTGIALTPDGALLPHARPAAVGETESAARSIAGRLHSNAAEIHDALEQQGNKDFDRTSLALRVFALAEQKTGRPLPRAQVPEIDLHGPKISRKLTTRWYANRVEGRFERCLRQNP